MVSAVISGWYLLVVYFVSSRTTRSQRSLVDIFFIRRSSASFMRETSSLTSLRWHLLMKRRTLAVARTSMIQLEILFSLCKNNSEWLAITACTELSSDLIYFVCLENLRSLGHSFSGRRKNGGPWNQMSDISSGGESSRVALSAMFRLEGT